MKLQVLILNIYCCVCSIAHAQDSSQISTFSKELQNFVNSNRIKLEKPFAFSKVKDSLHYGQHEAIRTYLKTHFVPNPVFLDSICYKADCYFDTEGDSVIIDVSGTWKIDDAVFINVGTMGDFVGGMDKTLQLMSTYLDSTLHDIHDGIFAAKVYLSNAHPFSVISVVSEDKRIKEAIVSCFDRGKIRYKPPIRFGFGKRPLLHSHFDFEIQRVASKFVVNCVGNGEYLFCYADDDALYAIEHISQYKPKRNDWTFLYDRKWTDEELWASPDIIRIKEKVDNSAFLNIMKEFREDDKIKPPSSMYQFHFIKK